MIRAFNKVGSALPAFERKDILLSAVNFVLFGLISTIVAPADSAIQTRPLAGRTVPDVPIVMTQSALLISALAAVITSSGIGSQNITVSNFTKPSHFSHGFGAYKGTKLPSDIRSLHSMHLNFVRLP